ncbi:phosphoenolpyruvate carboxykinase (GTP) [Treponema sp. R6D11]
MNVPNEIRDWVESIAELTTPNDIVYIDGSKEQLEDIKKLSLAAGEITELNQEILPNCYYHRTPAHDVARVEDRTFICTKNKEEAGPTNNWEDPAVMKEKLNKLYDGCMAGKTMYVIPFLMGPDQSPYSIVGVELTDSKYVVLNMAIMAQIGEVALNNYRGEFTKCLHSVGTLNPEERYITHFPETNEIMSINSGYGGNVLLGKKCLALRIASYLGNKQGWLAEHMLILGIENPQGEVHYVAAAFPSACGKTNLAMLVPPEKFKGYKIWCVGDDIAWLHVKNGQLYAINPEAGFFGVAPGTSEKTNPNALKSVLEGTIFTNVAVTPDGDVWWEGKGPKPEKAIDWKGNAWTPDSDEPAAHANSRFTAPAKNCPCFSPEWSNPEGVPISAIIFGGRRTKLAPLVYEAKSYNEGVFLGATMASETTAAAIGAVGKLRRDPFAMLPFCGYNMADYFSHWIEIGKQLTNPPKFYHVNWFKKDEDGNFLWPGFGENLAVLNWIIERVENKKPAVETPIGNIPTKEDMPIDNYDVLFDIDKTLWKEETDSITDFFESLGNVPPALQERLEELKGNIA